jgi:hypothetical protein
LDFSIQIYTCLFSLPNFHLSKSVVNKTFDKVCQQLE